MDRCFWMDRWIEVFQHSTIECLLSNEHKFIRENY